MPSYYIAPTSDIWLCTGVPLDADYEHTLFFNPFGGSAAMSAQFSAISAYCKSGHHFTNQYYQRAEKNKLRIQALYDNVVACNYLIFQNGGSFGGKYFYAFITHAEYINNNTTEITYEIDVMQTFNFDYELGDCFVEREHVIDDTFGKNLVDEALATGEYIVNTSIGYDFPYTPTYSSPSSYVRITYIPNDYALNKYYYAANSAFSDVTDTPFTAGRGSFMTCGQVQTGCYVLFPLLPNDLWTTEFMTCVVQKLLSIQANIMSIDAIPAKMVSDYNLTSGTTLLNLPPQTPTDHTFSFNEGLTFPSVSGSTYTPHNNKMYQYPYRKIILTNHSGKNNELRWELFQDRGSNNLSAPTFKVQNFVIPTACSYCFPVKYRGVNDTVGDYDNGISLDNFATFPWSEDSFTKWVSENSSANSQKVQNSILSGTLRGLTSVGIAALTVASGGSALPVVAAAGAGAGAIIGGINATESIVAASLAAEATPDASCGTFNRNDVQYVNDRLGFTAYDMAIQAENAERIDKFFDMYGYKVNALKIPNIRQQGAIQAGQIRAIWNYVKCTDVIIHPYGNTKGIPQAAENKIAEIYAKGVTFWNAPANVGNYNSLASSNLAPIGH